MQKSGILNAQLRYLLARSGHRDRLALTDAGFNNPSGVELVDLAFLPNVPTILQVLDGILEEFTVERVILASEIETFAPELLHEYRARFEPDIPMSFVPHSEFDLLMPQVKGVIRTGQYGLHAPNIIIEAGCTY
ncbi:MAG: D-ribose pyranase [Propionicimonas sp.]|nr:D-ribose pyranase [Propionicimonas sp.]